jgi:glycosyltransferase involved in cell wall biosynthesis
LLLGQLIERKGIKAFLSAAREYFSNHPHDTVEIVIAGRGNQEAFAKQMIFPKNLQVRFLGSVQYSELPAIMTDCAVMVFPTLADEWGMVVNEAMAAGMLVAASIHAQSTVEMIQDGVNGLIYDPDLPESTFKIIDRLIAIDEVSANNIRQQARITAQKWSPEWSAKLFVGGISRLLTEKNT